MLGLYMGVMLAPPFLSVTAAPQLAEIAAKAQVLLLYGLQVSVTRGWTWAAAGSGIRLCPSMQVCCPPRPRLPVSRATLPALHLVPALVPALAPKLVWTKVQ